MIVNITNVKITIITMNLIYWTYFDHGYVSAYPGSFIRPNDQSKSPVDQIIVIIVICTTPG